MGKFCTGISRNTMWNYKRKEKKALGLTAPSEESKNRTTKLASLQQQLVGLWPHPIEITTSRRREDFAWASREQDHASRNFPSRRREQHHTAGIYRCSRLQLIHSLPYQHSPLGWHAADFQLSGRPQIFLRLLGTTPWSLSIMHIMITSYASVLSSWGER